MAGDQTGQEERVDCKSHNLNIYNTWWSVIKIKISKGVLARNRHASVNYLGVNQRDGNPIVNKAQ